MNDPCIPMAVVLALFVIAITTITIGRSYNTHKSKHGVICTKCKYNNEKKQECFHPDHLEQSYITGIVYPGNCWQYNTRGQCKKFTPKGN